MKNKTDWVKGHSFTAFRLDLDKRHIININVRQHQSGKVTVYQGVSKLIGNFEDLFKGTLDLDEGSMDLLNRVLLKIKEVK